MGADDSGDDAQAKSGAAVAHDACRLIRPGHPEAAARGPAIGGTIVRAVVGGGPRAGLPPGRVLLPAGLEHMREVRFGDPAAAVGDRDDGPVTVPADFHGDPGAGGAVDDRVEHHIPDGAPHRGAVGEGQAFPLAAAVERNAALARSYRSNGSALSRIVPAWIFDSSRRSLTMPAMRSVCAMILR